LGADAGVLSGVTDDVTVPITYSESRRKLTPTSCNKIAESQTKVHLKPDMTIFGNLQMKVKISPRTTEN